MPTIFLVPIAAILLFLAFGNEGRRRAIFVLPFVSLFMVWLIGGWATLVGALALILPFFFIKELLLVLPRGDRPSKQRARRWTMVGIGIAVGMFAVLKNYFDIGSYLFASVSLDALSPILAVAGLSFVVFRVIEYLLVDIGAGSPTKQTALRGGVVKRFHKYISFCLAFPSFTSGPILRWRGFEEDYSGTTVLFENRTELTAVLSRLANGLLRLSVLSQPLFLIVIVVNDQLKSHVSGPDLGVMQLAFVALMAVFYLHFLYVNFSAFSDVMIASARFIGLRLPENFDRPFSAYNFLDFFNHWHLSVSLWFRDMLFTPIAKIMIMRGVKSNTVCSAVAFLVTFGLLGLWHGRTWPFLLCGLLLGLGALVAQMYRDILRKAVDKRLGKGSWPHWLARLWLRALTYYYIALAIMGLWLNPATLSSFWKTTFSVEFLAISIAIVSVYSICIAGLEKVAEGIGLNRDVLAQWWGKGGLGVIALKIAVAVLLWYLLSVDNETAFVYEGF